MKTYYLSNLVILMLVVLLSGQTPPAKTEPSVENSKFPPTAQETSKKKDSLVQLTNKNLDEAIRIGNSISSKQDELAEVRKMQHKAMQDYIVAVNKYLKATNRKETIVVVRKKTDVLTQLREGEIFLNKDSTCIKTKRPLFGKKRCVQWGNYTFTLEDKNGNIEKL